MPNINFNAPVIRLGMSTQGGKGDLGPGTPTSATRGSNAEPLGGRRGLGAAPQQAGVEQQRQQIRESMMALAPPTREEIMRTIFVGNITEGIGGDAGLERLLHAASGGKLRRWFRAQDADNKACKFGFAEFDDAEGLETVSEVLKGGVEVPTNRVDPKSQLQNGNGESKGEDEGEEDPVKKSTLLVVVDQESIKYAEDWRSRRNEDPDAHQFRIDGAKEALSQVVATLFHPPYSATDMDGDTTMHETELRADPVTGEVITIPINVEDELSDIPAAMRETVAAEIAAFRDRSTRRDMERLKREEELESMERNRNGPRINRLGSPPIAAPSGPAGGANGIPLGPRAAQGVQGAPSGPKGYTGVQLPKDYQNGVSFVNGTNTAALNAWLSKEDSDSDVSDEELENRRRAKKDADQEKLYLDYERRWLNRERQRTAAVEREKAREGGEDAELAKLKEQAKQRMLSFNDDEEAQRKTDLYYQDRSVWLRNRSAFRQREAAADERDRIEEDRERANEDAKARGAADSFLDRQATEIGERIATQQQQQQQREPARFKMNLGSAAAKAQQAAAPTKRRTVADVEGLLEDEEMEDATAKRTLVPIQFDASTLEGSGRHLSDEERAAAVKQLAADIPTDKAGLWKWDVQWEFLDDGVIREQLRPFVEKKIMELLGVQEEMLVDVVEEGVRGKRGAEEMVGELEGVRTFPIFPIPFLCNL